MGDKLTLHEKVAYALASSNIVGDHMSYESILIHIKKRIPEEMELLMMAQDSFDNIVCMCKRHGLPAPGRLDDWLREAKTRYDRKHKDAH